MGFASKVSHFNDISSPTVSAVAMDFTAPGITDYSQIEGPGSLYDRIANVASAGLTAGTPTPGQKLQV